MPPAMTAADQNGGQPIQVVQPYYKIVQGVPAAIVRSYKQPL